MISTSPPAGAKAPKGSTVTMIVSSGASPTTTLPLTTTTQSSNTTTVPGVLGDDQATAEAAISGAGLTPACQATGTPGNGKTIRQTPSRGTQAQRGSTVAFTINDTACA